MLFFVMKTLKSIHGSEVNRQVIKKTFSVYEKRKKKNGFEGEDKWWGN